MKKMIYALILFSFSIGSIYSQTKKTEIESDPRKRWFEDARFGMFVHFGPYSVLANGEWIMNNRPERPVTTNAYRIFNPQQLAAKEWVQIAKGAGAKYITFTSRHHDSFSNWNTKQSDWNIMNTPYDKDLIKQLADECHKEGIKLVLYYSLLIGCGQTINMNRAH